MEDLFHRHPTNPILVPRDAPTPTSAVLNPGVEEVDGEVIRLVRVEDKRGIGAADYCICLATAKLADLLRPSISLITFIYCRNAEKSHQRRWGNRRVVFER